MGTGDGGGMTALIVVIVVEGKMICALGLHNVIVITITVTLLHTSVEICGRLVVSDILHDPLKSHPHNKSAACSSPHFRAISRLYSSSLESTIEESPRTRKALESSRSTGCFALRSLRCCVHTVPSRAKPLGPLQWFSQWLLNTPAFSAITCSTAYLGTWKSKSSNNPTRCCRLDNLNRLFRTSGATTDKTWCLDNVSRGMTTGRITRFSEGPSCPCSQGANVSSDSVGSPVYATASC